MVVLCITPHAECILLGCDDKLLIRQLPFVNTLSLIFVKGRAKLCFQSSSISVHSAKSKETGNEQILNPCICRLYIYHKIKLIQFLEESHTFEDGQPTL